MSEIKGTFMAICKKCGGTEERTNKWTRVICMKCRTILKHERYENSKDKKDLSTLGENAK